MKINHTTGQWESLKTESITVPFIIKANGKEIANICWGIRINVVESFEEVQANATLIAAAPSAFRSINNGKVFLG